jgi:hypothetical protein
MTPLFYHWSEDDLARLTAQYLAERAEEEDVRTWVRRAYPTWSAGMHFAVSAVIRQRIG